jgi:hypothetical protein
MIGSIVAAFALASFAQATPRKYEVSERLRELDQTWVSVTNKARRALAIPKITFALQTLRNEGYAESCRAIDEATAALLGREPTPEDALTLRFDPPIVEPRTAAKLRISWSYRPSIERPVRIQVGRQSVVALPGRDLVLEVRPETLNPEILQNPEVGYLMPVQVGVEQRNVFLSIVKRSTDRLNYLKNTKQPEALGLARFIQKVLADPEAMEWDVPIIQYIFTAELLDEGRLRLDRADTLPLVTHNKTSFRATFPRQVRGSLTLVIGFPGEGASEATFFESYGKGRAVTEALKRNWAFVSPRASTTAVDDVLDWIRTRRKQPIRQVFMIGHSGGADFALNAGGIEPRPKAIAAFAPILRELPAGLDGIPLFLSVGKQDSIAGDLRVLSQGIQSRKHGRFEEFDPCEHLMVVGESLPSAYKFFDSVEAR